MNSKRPYTMTTRAKSAAETRRRILRAAFDLQSERLTAEISLEAIAAEAGVSVQTVLRHFGSRAGLFEAAVTFANELIAEERRAPVGDVRAAVHVVCEHYETRGDLALMVLAQESTSEHLATVSEAGKVTHRTWVREVFGPQLAELDGSRRDEAVDLLVVATDVYTWKLLRRDRRLSRAQTEQRLETLVTAVLAATEGRKDT